MLPHPVQEQLALWFLAEHKAELRSIESVAVSGGSINNTFRVMLNGQPFFLKTNKAGAYPGMFVAEAAGLLALQDKSPIKVATPLHWGDAGSQSFLLTEWLERGIASAQGMFGFGAALAQLHANSTTHFGFDAGNYIGTLPQSNSPHSGWIDFFVSERIEPQIKMAIDAGLLSKLAVKHVNSLFGQLDGIFPPTAPCLLHGDLWSGNYFIMPTADAALFDPAVYYGHYEVDLAMTKLFGGFSADFYNGYQSIKPLEPAFDKRVPIYNLYPLLVHVNLFGGSYVYDVKAIIEQF